MTAPAPDYTAVPDGYVIHNLSDPWAIAKLEAVQQQSWGYDDREVTPGSVLTVGSHIGGIVAAAYHRTNPEQPLGFAYGFPGLRHAYAVPVASALPGSQPVVHHSHMLAVVPEHRASGLAVALKHHQRHWARQTGHDLMVWTMDPLLAKNARLNLGKLGARAVAYYPNWYALRGGIYAGLPADRLLIAWDIANPTAPTPAPSTPTSSAPTSSAPAPLLAAATHDVLTGPGPITEAALAAPQLSIEVPRDIEAVKAHDLAVAQAWREASREAFLAAFAQGYTASDLAYGPQGRVWYVLHRS
jgi:predicted GNAT superfamily acetyltransferase